MQRRVWLQKSFLIEGLFLKLPLQGCSRGLQVWRVGVSSQPVPLVLAAVGLQLDFHLFFLLNCCFDMLLPSAQAWAGFFLL